MGSWDIRNPQEMADLRNELLACPDRIKGKVLVDFLNDPVVGLAFRLAGKLGVVGSLGLFSRPDIAQDWRQIVDNIIPSDGRHATEEGLSRLLQAAGRHGWRDPRQAELDDQDQPLSCGL